MLDCHFFCDTFSCRGREGNREGDVQYCYIAMSIFLAVLCSCGSDEASNRISLSRGSLSVHTTDTIARRVKIHPERGIAITESDPEHAASVHVCAKH